MRFNIIKREPSYFFENMHEDLTRFLRDTFGDLEPVNDKNIPFERTFRPAVEVKETKDEYKIDVELAGVKKDDISVELTPDSVSISAEMKWENKKEDENVNYSEFRYGKFHRIIPLESPINLDDANSEYKDGVLHIIIKKTEPQDKNVKKIDVK